MANKEWDADKAVIFSHHANIAKLNITIGEYYFYIHERLVHRPDLTEWYSKLVSCEITIDEVTEKEGKE